MQIIKSTAEDINVIFDLYDKAIVFQKVNSTQHWLPFERSLVEKELKEDRQWKIMMNGDVACVFAIAFSDPFIWKEKNSDSAIYIHRIVTNPLFRGNNFVAGIVEWAKHFARENYLKYIRMDTWGDNLKLKEHYLKFGFNYLGIITPEKTDQLPSHYSSITLALFELSV
ncbi:MAG: GNAT family N-acetyltransferase [Bacteroidetes bacterium]|nr:GNAT family N-acetyltransferase [Bacteroidota bacterium]